MELEELQDALGTLSDFTLQLHGRVNASECVSRALLRAVMESSDKLLVARVEAYLSVLTHLFKPEPEDVEMGKGFDSGIDMAKAFLKFDVHSLGKS